MPGLLSVTHPHLLGNLADAPRLQEGKCSSSSLECTVRVHLGGSGQRAMASQLRQEIVLLLVIRE